MYINIIDACTFTSQISRHDGGPGKITFWCKIWWKYFSCYFLLCWTQKHENGKHISLVKSVHQFTLWNTAITYFVSITGTNCKWFISWIGLSRSSPLHGIGYVRHPCYGQGICCLWLLFYEVLFRRWQMIRNSHSVWLVWIACWSNNTTPADTIAISAFTTATVAATALAATASSNTVTAATIPPAILSQTPLPHRKNPSVRNI